MSNGTAPTNDPDTIHILIDEDEHDPKEKWLAIAIRDIVNAILSILGIDRDHDHTITLEAPAQEKPNTADNCIDKP